VFSIFNAAAAMILPKVALTASGRPQLLASEIERLLLDKVHGANPPHLLLLLQLVMCGDLTHQPVNTSLSGRLRV
jgi:hypothetical protein